MYNHEPKDYICPFCRLLRGEETDKNKTADIVYQNEHATASIAPKWWARNPGGVLVFPNIHHENIYDIPEDTLAEVYKVVKKVSIAIRETYDCEGTSTRQHNEPAGNQDVWHLHVHVFGRNENDMLYRGHDDKKYVTPEERLPYAEKLRAYFEA